MVTTAKKKSTQQHARGNGHANEATWNRHAPDAVPLSAWKMMAATCDHFVLYNVSWDFYRRFDDEIGERPWRLNFDGQNLEVMNLSRAHERPKGLLGRLIETLTLELDIPLASGGSLTVRREDVQRGLEPDECYWIASADQVEGDHELDFTKDPPPDLVIEVEKSRTILDRIGIYAKLGVPEIWRCDGKSVSVWLLRNGKYVESPRSLSFPFLPVEQLAQFLVLSKGHTENGQVRSFIKWVRKQRFKH